MDMVAITVERTPVPLWIRRWRDEVLCWVVAHALLVVDVAIGCLVVGAGLEWVEFLMLAVAGHP